MEKHNKDNKNSPALDEDILEMLAEAHEPVEIDDITVMRMRNKLIVSIGKDKTALDKGFDVIHAYDANGWIEAFPGGSFKVLHGDINEPEKVLSYLIKLEPGYSMKGHGHPFDEETLMLEGDLTLGEINLKAGDFHFAEAGVTHGNVSTKNGCIAFMRGALPI
jgi:quercetin dioxygenase-like cupin family protein